MRSRSLRYALLFSSLLAGCPIAPASAKSPSADSVSTRSANALLVELARLIKEYAYSGGAMVYRYSAYADTTLGRKLYVGQKRSMLGDRSDEEWYCIDFTQPISARQLRVIQGRNGNGLIDASRRITQKLKRRVREGQPHERGRKVRLFIFFNPKKNERKVDYDQLTDLISQLITHGANHLRASEGF
jgi:hypothetical protein